MNYKNGRPVVIGDVARGYHPAIVHLLVGVVLAFTQDGIRDQTVQLACTRPKKLRRSAEDGTDALNIGEMVTLTVPAAGLELEYRDEMPYPVPARPETLVQGDVPTGAPPMTPGYAASLEFNAGAALRWEGKPQPDLASDAARLGYAAMGKAIEDAEFAAAELAALTPLTVPETKPSEAVTSSGQADGPMTAAPIVDGTVRAELADAVEAEKAAAIGEPVASDAPLPEADGSPARSGDKTTPPVNAEAAPAVSQAPDAEQPAPERGSTPEGSSATR